MSDHKKVVKFKKRKSINIGIIIFLILFLYIVINVYIYFTKDKLSIYEVHEGTTAIENRITSLILRDEEVIYSEQAGYISYYQKDGARVAKNAAIYSVNDTVPIYNTASNAEELTITLSKKNHAEIKHEIRNFINTFSLDQYSDVYDFKEDAEGTVLDILNNNLLGEQENTSVNSNAVHSQESGIITYYLDNFETIIPGNVTGDMFQPDNYTKTSLRAAEIIEQGKPVYKIITSDRWNLVLPLTNEQYDRLSGKEKVTFTVLEDNTEMTAGLTFSQNGAYAILQLDKYVSSYVDDRFLDIEIDFDSVKGLKIPNTSIVEKDFYLVPIDYFPKGGNSSDYGLIKENYNESGELSFQFIPTEIYYEDEDYAYIDAQMFTAGTWVRSTTEDSNRYQLSTTKKLTGVYNVNSGYAVFKPIDILYTGEEYIIVKDNTKYGLSAYDHIVLVGSTAVEQGIIY